MAGGPAIPAQVTYNRSRLAEVMALSGGVVRRIAAEPGQSVGKGDPLAEIASPGAAHGSGRLSGRAGAAGAGRGQRPARAGAGGQGGQRPHGAGAGPGRAAGGQGHGRAVARAAGRLRCRQPAGSGTSLALRSPLAGTVVARSAVAGQTLAPETPLFTVADLSNMWLELQVSADQTEHRQNRRCDRGGDRWASRPALPRQDCPGGCRTRRAHPPFEGGGGGRQS
ncbi:MAG: efflux RND transporter periplasmic adaptor subunit [Comamonadaceae bacterium]|nr:efflux RND transporter periplasmic adaptor subunit [Comamonadaceae bacterium]